MRGMSKAPPEIPTPTIDDLKAARKAFDESESRDLYYRAATELAGLALKGHTSLSVTEALAVLPQTWNKAFYRFTLSDSRHFSDLERVVTRHEGGSATLRGRSIQSFSGEDVATVEGLFGSFEEVLGPVGAAKCLHLLAPHYFPLWTAPSPRHMAFPSGSGAGTPNGTAASSRSPRGSTRRSPENEPSGRTCSRPWTSTTTADKPSTGRRTRSRPGSGFCRGPDAHGAQRLTGGEQSE